jgi:hypothetical protein
VAAPDLAARLREALTGARPRPASAARQAVASIDRAERAARTLGGAIVERDSGVTLTVDRICRAPVPAEAEVLDRSPVELLSRLFGRLAVNVEPRGREPASSPASSPGVMFFDLETTGLAGGAGTHAFILGLGWFEDDRFRVRQFFLPGLDLERPMLEAAADEVLSSRGLASYNGRTFDVPLIETRYLFHRMEEPFTGLPHLDLLHPARRLWWQEEGCRLTTLERRLLGVERGDDVPGFEIPERYFAYLRSGDPALVEPVLDHNRMDIVTLAGLTMRLAWLYEVGPEASRDGAECFGLGSLFERTGQVERALASYERAASLARHFEDELRLDASHRRALLLRRCRRHGEAFDVWKAIAGAPRGASGAARRDALRALAVHHEHRSKDLGSAREFALESLGVERGRGVEAARHRLGRLNRKLGAPPDGTRSGAPGRALPGLLDPPSRS